MKMKDFRKPETISMRRRKRTAGLVRLLILFSAVLTCFLLGCRPRTSSKYPEIIYPDEYVEGQDFNPTAFSWADTPNMAAVTDDGIYFKAGIFLFFADKTTLKARPLCFKIGCMHMLASHERVGKCNAFCDTPIGKEFVGVFRDSLYFSGRDIKTGKYELYSASLDGSNRKVLLPDINPIIMKSMRIHRGVMYYPESVIDLDGNVSYTLFAIDLLGGKSKPEALFSGSNVTGSFSDVLPYGNYIYYNEKFLVEREDGTKATKDRYSRYCITDGTIETLTELTDLKLYGILDHQLIFYDGFHYYEMDPEEKTISLSERGIERFQNSHPEWTCNAGSMAEDISFFNCGVPKGDYVRKLIVVNEKGEELCRLDDPAYILPYNTNQTIMIDGKAYFLHFRASTRPYIVELFAIEDLLQGKTNSRVLLRVMDLNDLCPGYSYTTK